MDGAAPAPTEGAGPGTGPLRAVGFRIDDDPDLVEFAGPNGMVITRDGAGLAGIGTAAVLSFGPGERHLAAGMARDVLGGMQRTGAVGAPAPVAFGALPYDPDAGGRLIVPAVQVHRHRDGSRWAVVVGRGEPSEAPVQIGRAHV